jgi:hypothetical protein
MRRRFFHVEVKAEKGERCAGGCTNRGLVFTNRIGEDQCMRNITEGGEHCADASLEAMSKTSMTNRA